MDKEDLKYVPDQDQFVLCSESGGKVCWNIGAEKWVWRGEMYVLRDLQSIVRAEVDYRLQQTI